MFFSMINLYSIEGQYFVQNGRVVIIGFGIGHVDTLDKTNMFSAKTMLTNSVKWASGLDSPKILLLVDPSVNLLGTRSLDPDFIENTLSKFSIIRSVDSFKGISFSELEEYDLVIWSGESFPLRSPLISNTPRALLEFFETGHGIILISDDATWDSSYDKNADPKISSDITRSLTHVSALSTGKPRNVETIVTTFDGQRHPIMNGVLAINILSDKIPTNFTVPYYSNDIDESLPGFGTLVLAKSTNGNPAVVVHEFTGNRFPIQAFDDNFIVYEDSKHNDFFVLYNDLSKTDRLSIDSFDTVSLVGNLESHDDHFSFTPKANFSGKTTFNYTVKDGMENRDVAIAHITVNAVNDKPVAKSSSFVISEDSILKSRLQASDVDGDSLKFILQEDIDPNTGNLSLFADGRIIYSPPENYVGTTSFTFTVDDGHRKSLAESVTIKIIAENDLPVIRSSIFFTPEDKVLTGILDAKDPDGTFLTFSLVNDTPHSTGQTSIMTHGAFSFIPKKGFTGDTYFVFEVDDGQNKKQQTVTITVIPKGTPPEAIDTSISVEEDSIAVITLEGFDAYGYDLSYKVITQPKHGIISEIDNEIQYVPDTDYYGSDEIIFEVNNNRFSDSGKVSIKITPVNDPPEVMDDRISTKENTEVVIPVLFNDVDVDGDEMNIISVEKPINGKTTINLAKSISYQPNPGVVNDVEIFYYTISDSLGTNSTGRITVNVLQKENTSGEIHLTEGKFNSDTEFSLDVDSDGKSFSGNLKYEDKFAGIHLNSDSISFFSIDQTENSATFGGVSFNDEYFSIFVDDNGVSGRDDVMKIKIRNSEGSLIYQKEGTLSKGMVTVSSNFFEIPMWIKNNAKWWSNGQIRDSDFIEAMQFLIKNDMMVIPSIPESVSSQEKVIPLWIKNNAKWWSEDKLSDSEFVDGIKFLIINGFLKI